MSAGSAFTGGYDANGNTTSRNGLTQSWASFGLPTLLQATVNGSTYSSQFSYGPDHERYKQSATYSNGTESTVYAGGLLEKVTASTLGNKTDYRHYVQTPSGKLIVAYRNSDGSSSIDYVLSDHLGSSDAIVSGSGSNAGGLLVQESFDAYGKRRASNWSAGSPGSGDYAAIATSTRKGFTSAEELDNIGLVHMNGRVYDPTVGRFLSADPIIGSLTDSQLTNPYAYVGNRPLITTDPSGEDPALDTVVVESGGPTNPVGVAATVADIAVDVFGLSGLFGAAPPPPAVALNSASAQSGLNDNPCSSGAAGGSCGPAGDDSDLPSILVQGPKPPTAAWVGMDLRIAGTALGGRITRVVPTPDDPESIATVYVMAHGFPSAMPAGWSFSDFLYYGLVRPTFGLFDCIGGACSGTQAALMAISPMLMALPVPEAEGAELAGRGVLSEVELDATKETSYLYRGVHAGHPEIEAARAGRAVPGNLRGTVTAAEHNAGGVSANSPFTSWTRDINVARRIAGENGVILRVPTGAPPPGATWSWEWSPDIYHEGEVLLRGVREGCTVILCLR
jgi:RHS repeat-associated protein